MGFRNPVATADQITGGAFAGTYTVPGLFVVGDPAGRHVALSGPTDALELYSGDASETAPGSVTGDVSTFRSVTTPTATIKSPTAAGVYGRATVSPTNFNVGDSAGNPIDVWGNSFRDPNGGYIPRWLGDSVQRSIDSASPSVTTDASGNVSIPHNLGVTPVAVIVNTGLSATALIAETGTYTDAIFVLRLKTDAGAAFVGTLTIHYIAIG